MQSGITITLLDHDMTESKDKVTTWQYDNTFIPTYIPDHLKWFERDGLETWYTKNKCNQFLEDTDSHFRNRLVVNFDMITNDKKLDPETIKQYCTVDDEEIKKYPQKYQNQIFSSIFRNIGRKDLHVNNQTIKEHFDNKKKQLDVVNF